MSDALTRLKSALSSRYQIERELGAGGMATVYLAQDLKHDRKVAIKVLKPELAATLGTDRFLREIQTAAKLNHPHLMPLHDSGEADGLLYYVMPLVEGESLRDRLTREKHLAVEEALAITRDVASALDYAHGHDVIHRDVKPENIMLASGHAIVTDFGIARAISEAGGNKLTETGIAVGTPAYMSPEQAAGEAELDQRTDVYALGCVLYEMLVGDPPFMGTSAQAILARKLTEPPPSVQTVRRTVPAGVAQTLGRALATVPADRIPTAKQLVAGITAADVQPAAGLTGLSARPARPIVLIGVLVAAGVATALLLGKRTRGGELDANILVVAPFDALGSGLEVWGEGLADMVSHSLDGAGPLRTVSPSVAVRAWSGRADPASAAQLGARLGAGLAVYGRLVASGSDSVRLSATLLNVASQAVMGDMEVRDHRDNVDRLSDSLAVRLLGELSRTRQLRSAQLNSLGSSVPAALKAFLQGEQHWRRASLDSADFYYQRAIELDSTFALAYNRMGNVAWWPGAPAVRPYYELLFRAGALNRGLAVRESLLVAADSIFAAVNRSPAPDSTTWTMIQRLFATLERVDRHYPNDPEIQYRLAEARFHTPVYGRAAERLRESLARVVELDSTFAPAYVHLIQLQGWLQEIEPARRSIAAMLALGPSDAVATRLRIVDAMLDPARATSPEVEMLLDTASAEALQEAWFPLVTLPDSAQPAIRVARALYAKRSPSSAGESAREQLAWILAFRGHLQEAKKLVEDQGGFLSHAVFTELALLGAVPRERAAHVFAGFPWWQRQVPMPWWASIGDTTAIEQARASFESDIRWSQLGLATSLVAEADFYFALARRDTTDAQRLASRIPEYHECRSLCYHRRLAHAQLLTASGSARDAAQLLDAGSTNVIGPRLPGEVVWRLERARVHEGLGNPDKAISDYTFVVNVWRYADDLLQPLVTEARKALQRLTGEAPS